MKLRHMIALVSGLLLASGCGQPGAPNPDAGDVCQVTGATCSDCTSCALNGACTSAYAACLTNRDCNALNQCAQGCGTDSTCLQSCYTNNPNGQADYMSVEQCVYCQQCPGDCPGQCPT